MAALELATLDIADVRTGQETTVDGDTLVLNVEELRELVLRSDGPFKDLRIHIVRPGDSVRLINVVDCVEPRCREDGLDFPGMLGTPLTVGEGRTRRLGGLAITEVSEPVAGEPTYWREAIIDMSGEGAPYSPLSQVVNIVLEFIPADDFLAGERGTDGDVTNIFGGNTRAVEYNEAVRKAGLQAAVYVTKATQHVEPTRTDTYDLDQPAAEGLPRIVYLYQVQSPYVYGVIAPRGGSIGGTGHLPTVIGPTEILDGALVNSYNNAACLREPTYLMQNHGLVKELLERHGKDIDFVGVILFTSGHDSRTKERMSSYASNLARRLGAEGALLNYMGAGHHEVDVMMTCQKLERLGIKSTLLLMEMARNPEDSGFVHFVREADAIVSTGNYEEVIELPRLDHVIGGDRLLETGDEAVGPVKVPVHVLMGATDQLGSGTLRARQY